VRGGKLTLEVSFNRPATARVLREDEEAVALQMTEEAVDVVDAECTTSRIKWRRVDEVCKWRVGSEVEGVAESGGKSLLIDVEVERPVLPLLIFDAGDCFAATLRLLVQRLTDLLEIPGGVEREFGLVEGREMRGCGGRSKASGCGRGVVVRLRVCTRHLVSSKALQRLKTTTPVGCHLCPERWQRSESFCWFTPPASSARICDTKKGFDDEKEMRRTAPATHDAKVLAGQHLSEDVAAAVGVAPAVQAETFSLGTQAESANLATDGGLHWEKGEPQGEKKEDKVRTQRKPEQLLHGTRLSKTTGSAGKGDCKLHEQERKNECKRREDEGSNTQGESGR
jgi:hypothetical protein